MMPDILPNMRRLQCAHRSELILSSKYPVFLVHYHNFIRPGEVRRRFRLSKDITVKVATSVTLPKEGLRSRAGNVAHIVVAKNVDFVPTFRSPSCTTPCTPNFPSYLTFPSWPSHHPTVPGQAPRPARGLLTAPPPPSPQPCIAAACTVLRARHLPATSYPPPVWKVPCINCDTASGLAHYG